MAEAKCTVPECDKPANRKGACLCEAHYMRKRRHGTTDKIVPNTGPILHSQGYLLDYAPGHALRRSSVRMYQHRVVFFDQHGTGPFNCHWCGCVVTWEDMHVDHVDDDKQNDDLSNLVASCAICNQARGRWKMVAAYRERFGVTIRGEKRTWNEWAAFVDIARNAIHERIKKGMSIEDAVFTPRGVHGPQRGARAKQREERRDAR